MTDKYSIETFIKKIASVPGFKDDAFTLIYIFLARGNNVSKIMTGKTSTDGQKIMADLQKKYNLSDRVEGSQQSYPVTLSRIAESFPVLTVAVLSNEDGDIGQKRPYKKQSLDQQFGVDFPQALMSKITASVVPRTPQYIERNTLNMVLTLITVYCTLENRILDYKKASLDFDELYKLNVHYVNLSHNSPILTEEERKNVCMASGLSKIFDVSDKLKANDYLQSVFDAVVDKHPSLCSLNKFDWVK